MKEDNSQKLRAEEPDLEGEPRLRAPSERRYLIIGASVVLLVLLVIIVAVWKWRKSSEATEEAVTPVVSVRVAKAEKQQIAAPISAVGTIFPREQATVAAKVSAQIKHMGI